MRNKNVCAAFALVLIFSFSGSLLAGSQLNEDEKLALRAATVIGNNYLYTMFDYIQVETVDGVITLYGKVTEPRKIKDYILDLKDRLGEDQEIKSEVEILPSSFSDDRIRENIRKGILRDPGLLPYSFMRYPEPVHIIVANGHVKLEGVILARMDKKLIESKARGLFGVFSVENNLELD